MQLTTAHQGRPKIFTSTDKTRSSRVWVICGWAAAQHKWSKSQWFRCSWYLILCCTEDITVQLWASNSNLATVVHINFSTTLLLCSCCQAFYPFPIHHYEGFFFFLFLNHKSDSTACRIKEFSLRKAIDFEPLEYFGVTFSGFLPQQWGPQIYIKKEKKKLSKRKKIRVESLASSIWLLKKNMHDHHFFITPIHMILTTLY